MRGRGREICFSFSFCFIIVWRIGWCIYWRISWLIGWRIYWLLGWRNYWNISGSLILFRRIVFKFPAERV